MPASNSYRDLKIWQLAMDLVPRVYVALRDFPKEENFALASQIRRAVISIPANIAEGQARAHRKEFAHFLSIAKGSLAELDTLLELAHRLRYLSAADHELLQKFMQNLVRPLQALQNWLKSPD